MIHKERDRAVYEIGKEFLLSLDSENITEDVLEKYWTPILSGTLVSLSDIYMRLLESAQNANMKSKVIGSAVGGVPMLGPVLMNFDSQAVVSKYASSQEIFEEIKVTLKPKGKMRNTTRSIWPQYCKTILSAAKFVSQFSSAEDFLKWVQTFDQDNRSRVALPIILSQEIEGLGFALSCDFLKELGYPNFGKPDVHLRDIFKGLNLCEQKVNDYHLFQAIIRVANNVGNTPYAVDKLFWLIGSGYFYLDTQIGKGGRLGSKKKKFIAFARRRLAKT